MPEDLPDEQLEDATLLVLTVSDEESGARVDAWLPRVLPGVSRSRARFLADEGRVRLAGRPLRKGDRLPAGAMVEVEESEAAREPLRALPEDEPTVYTAFAEDGLVVLDKPPGMPSVPLRAGELGTVANVLAHRFPEALAFDPVEAGLLQRLDRDTSGLVAAAVDETVYELMIAVRREVGFEKAYLALVAGVPDAGVLLDRPIAPTPADPSTMRVLRHGEDAARALPAETFIDTVDPLPGDQALVLVRTRTGRRHQVRVHLAAAGHPLAGDARYGGAATPGLERHFLHAHELSLPHPSGDEVVRIQSPLPADLRSVLERILPA